jgi:hypothetical protein
MDKIFFAHPHTIFNQVEKVLKDVGPVNFFKSPDERVKKAREGFAAYFFTLGLKKYTNRDWWLAQYDQETRAYPDFDFISFAENPDDIKIEAVELTGVYPHFESFDKVIKVVEKKQKKYGDKPAKFSLLVFVNHTKSEEWINLLREKIKNEYPFISIWTTHLLFKDNGKEVKKAIVQRIMPLPGLRIEADTDDHEIHKPQPVPYYMEQLKDGEITLKAELINKLRNKIKEVNKIT